jgi:hypothetical protein
MGSKAVGWVEAGVGVRAGSGRGGPAAAQIVDERGEEDDDQNGRWYEKQRPYQHQEDEEEHSGLDCGILRGITRELTDDRKFVVDSDLIGSSGSSLGGSIGIG